MEVCLVKPLVPEAAATAELLNRMILESQRFLNSHSVNKQRLSEGKMPANSLWPWSPGTRPKMMTFKQRFSATGAAISAVDLIKGLAIYAGLDVIDVKGATGLYDTNYEGKADACLKALETHDFVYMHVEAPDEASHNGNHREKIHAIENFDKKVVGTILEGLEDFERYRIMVVSDHFTPIVKRTHTEEPPPFAWAKKEELLSIVHYAIF